MFPFTICRPEELDASQDHALVKKALATAKYTIKGGVVVSKEGQSWLRLRKDLLGGCSRAASGHGPAYGGSGGEVRESITACSSPTTRCRMPIVPNAKGDTGRLPSRTTPGGGLR